MKKLTLLLFLHAFFGNAQIKVVMKNRDTDVPIAYANVWDGNKLVTSSDSLGIFYLREGRPQTRYRISAIGFETLEAITITETATILMANKVVTLDEIQMSPPKYDKKVNLGKLKNGDVGIVCRMDDLVPIIGKYFPNDSKATLFLDRLKFKAFSSAKNRIVAISLYSVDDDGTPDEPISTENIVCRLKKGHHVAEVDLRPHRIPFSERGIFVVIHYLPLEQNRCYAANNKEWFFYEPSLDAIENRGTPDWWNFTKDGWVKRDKYTLSVQLTLTD